MFRVSLVLSVEGESLIIPALKEGFGHFNDSVEVGAISAAVFYYFLVGTR